MKTISLWSEGYQATGESSEAIYHGDFEAKNLRDAIIQFKATLSPSSAATINIEDLTFWGCKFFDNEIDARKNFG